MSNSKILNEGLTYEDVLLIPNYSDILPYNLPESIEEKVNKNVEYIKKYKSKII